MNKELRCRIYTRRLITIVHRVLCNLLASASVDAFQLHGNHRGEAVQYFPVLLVLPDCHDNSIMCWMP